MAFTQLTPVQRNLAGSWSYKQKQIIAGPKDTAGAAIDFSTWNETFFHAYLNGSAAPPAVHGPTYEGAITTGNADGTITVDVGQMSTKLGSAALVAAGGVPFVITGKTASGDVNQTLVTGTLTIGP